jgi:hypothetical protein
MRTYFENLTLKLDLVKELGTKEFETAIKKLLGGSRLAGSRCAWCYKEDVDFWKTDSLYNGKIPHPGNWFYGGWLIPTPDYEMRGEIEHESCVVVVTQYPVEKCYVECDWTPLLSILTEPEIVRFHIMETIRPARLNA